jgi:hypothetical protein
MGSKGGTTQQTSSSSGPPPQVMAEYQGLVDRATNVANQPYQPYQGELVAPLTSQTNAGLGGISQYAGAAQPYLGAAGAMTMGASAPVNPAQFQGMGSLQNFMNPYTSSVVDTTQAEMNNQNQQQAQFLNSANISSGAFGGDRAGIGQSILANQQNLAEAPTIAGLNQANYTQAMQNWQNQQGVNLAAQQANRSAQLAGGAQLGQIGLSGQEAGLQGAQTQIQAGMIPQQEQQQIDAAAQQMYQQGQAYPFTTTGWLGNIIEGVGGQSGGTSQTTSPGPNSITQGLGAATSGMGLLTSLMSLSDERAKENVEEIGKTYDGQNIYRYNFKGDPRTQIGLLAQEEAYHHPGAVQRVGMGDLLGIDYHSATDDAAERGHYADGGAPDQGPPPGGMTQGVTQGAGQPQQRPQSMTPDMSLMYMGDPSARAGMGSFALMGGTNMHPQPELPLAGPSRPPVQVPLGGGGSGLSPLGGHLPSIFPSEPQSQGSGAAFGGRQGFQGGGAPQQFVNGNPAFGLATPGFDPGVSTLSPLAGVNEAVFGEETAGSKTPYTGLDFDQIQAISGGQWMPPQTGATMPDFQNLQNSPQFGAAEASLAGAFGGTQASQGVAPSVGGPRGPTPAVGGAPMPGAMGAAGATQGGLSRGGLGNIANEYFGGGSGGGGGSVAGAGSGGFGYTPGSTPVQNPPPAAAPAPAPQQAPPMAQDTGLPDAYEQQVRADQLNAATQSFGERAASGGRIGGATMRRGFQRGGFPSFTTYQPTANPQRNAPTYTALDLSHMFGGGQQAVPPAIQMQRQLQGRARATAAVHSGVVRPRVIARDPVTGQHHDITPLHDRPPFGTGPYNPGGQPYRPEDDPRPQPPGQEQQQQTQGPPGLVMKPPGLVPRADPTNLFSPASRGPGMGYPARGIVPADAPGTPEAGTLSNAAFRLPVPKVTVPTRSSPLTEGGRGLATVAPPLEGTQEWNKPSTSVEEPLDSGEFSEAGGRPLMAPRLVGADPMGQHTLLSPHSMQALPPPSGDEAPMFTEQDLGLPGTFRGGGRGITEARGGRVPRYYGGRIGRDDGGSIPIGGGQGNKMEAPSGFDPSNVDWSVFDQDMTGGDGGQKQPDLSGVDWKGLFGGGALGADMSGTSPQRAQIDPRAVAQAPSFQGAGGGGSGGGPHFTQVSNMGGPPISALDLSGHYQPTTGNARGATYVPGSPGAGINPNARAQAPEHPAITTMRHIVRAHDAARARPVMSHVDPNMGPIQRASDTSYGPQLPSEYDEYGYGIGARPTYGKPIPGSEGGGLGTSTGFQGGGGVLGASPVQNAGGYTPQGMGLSGQTSQGGGLGSIAAAKEGSGFGDLFGGGSRAGFASGGLPSAASDPFLSEITASMPQMSGGGGHGPPAPPPPAPPPAAGGDPAKGLGDQLGKLGDAAKKFMGPSGGNQTTPTLSSADQSQLQGLDYSAADTSAMNAATSGDVFSGLQDSDLGFQTGGGVGLGSLRGGFSDGGTPDASDAPSGFDQAITGVAAPVAAPAPTTGGGGKGGKDFLTALQHFESGGRNVPNTTQGTSSGQAQGYNQITTGTWHEFGGDQYAPDPLHATYEQQNAIAAKIPMGRWAPETLANLRGQGFTINPKATLADNIAANHGSLGAAPANVPSASATPASASTESYGGGFQIPGGGGPPPGQLDRSNLQAPTMGDEIKHDPGGYMMSVGAAMMASRSPWLGVGIGEGLEGGNKYLQSQKELEKSWGTAQAQINNLGAEARDKGADADLKAQQLQINAMMNKVLVARMRQRGLLGGGSGGTPAPGATGGASAPTGGQGTTSGGLTPLPTLSGGTAPSGAPSGSSAAPDPDAAPRIEDDKLYQQSQDLYRQAQDAELDDKLMGTHTAEDLRAQAKELSDAAQKNFEKTSAPYTAKLDAQKAGFTEYQKRADEFTGDYQSNVEMLTQLGKIYKSYQSGTGAEDFANVQGLADRLGITLPDGWNTSGKAGYDAAMKTAVDAAFQKMQSSGANKAPRSIMQEALTTSPTPTNDPAANWKIITETLARLKYSKEMMDSVMGSGSLNVTKAENEWMKTHGSLDPYRKEARKNTPLFRGMTPSKYKQVTGATMEKSSDGKWRDPESGKMWDEKGNPVN